MVLMAGERDKESGVSSGIGLMEAALSQGDIHDNGPGTGARVVTETTESKDEVEKLRLENQQISSELAILK